MKEWQGKKSHFIGCWTLSLMFKSRNLVKIDWSITIMGCISCFPCSNLNHRILQSFGDPQKVEASDHVKGGSRRTSNTAIFWECLQKFHTRCLGIWSIRLVILNACRKEKKTKQNKTHFSPGLCSFQLN